MTSAMPLRAPAGRVAIHIDGVLLLDKPVGPSSTRVLGHVKRLLGASKAGHGGTLDPMASGLLPVMFGEATKYAADGLDADKTYLADVMLGEKTSTGDAEGEVIATSTIPAELTAQTIATVLEKFRGPQTQIPPMYSALKKDGKALYAYARAGEQIVREPRNITIHQISLESVSLPVFTIRVTCSKGTYIRTLAEDIGAALGQAAHLKSLRRIGVGSLFSDQVVPLDAIEHASPSERLEFLKPVDWLIRDLSAVQLSASNAQRFTHGQSVMLSGDTAVGRVRVQNAHGQFIGTGTVNERKLLNPERVRVLSS